MLGYVLLQLGGSESFLVIFRNDEVFGLYGDDSVQCRTASQGFLHAVEITLYVVGDFPFVKSVVFGCLGRQTTYQRLAFVFVQRKLVTLVLFSVISADESHHSGFYH